MAASMNSCGSGAETVVVASSATIASSVSRGLGMEVIAWPLASSGSHPARVL